MANINITKSASCANGAGEIYVSFGAVNVGDYSIKVTGDNTATELFSPFFTGVSGGTHTFTGLPNDFWTIEVTETGGNSASTTVSTMCAPVTPVNDLTLQATAADATTYGAADGIINLAVTTSYPPIKSRLSNGSLTTGKTQYTGLVAGNYTVYVQDVEGFSKQVMVTVNQPAAPILGCTNPLATNYNPAATQDDGSCVLPRPPALFMVPLVNSLRFVEQITPDNCSIFKTHDNTLFCKEKITGVYNPGYYQKVASCDTLRIQYRSNFTTNTVTLHNQASDAQVRVITSDLKVAKVSAREFDVICNTLPQGRYYIRITVSDPDYGTRISRSEPFFVAQEHPATHLITYRNSENKFDTVYNTGIVHRVRIESVFYKRKPAGKSSTFRGCSGELIKLSSEKYRRILFETFPLPPYLNEKLAVIFEHDEIQVNGVEFQTDQSYEHEYSTGFGLAKGSVELEQVGWLNAYSGGEIEPRTGFIIINDGFLKV